METGGDGGGDCGRDCGRDCCGDQRLTFSDHDHMRLDRA